MCRQHHRLGVRSKAEPGCERFEELHRVVVVKVRREKALDFSGCNSRPGTGSLHPAAIETAAEATKLSDPTDEREQETESGQTELRRARRKFRPIAIGRLQPLRLLDSTLDFLWTSPEDSWGPFHSHLGHISRGRRQNIFNSQETARRAIRGCGEDLLTFGAWRGLVSLARCGVRYQPSEGQKNCHLQN